MQRFFCYIYQTDNYEKWYFYLHKALISKNIFFFFLLFSLQAFSQKVALKNNLAYDALLTPNLSTEFSLGKKWTLDTQVGMNFFFYENDATARRKKNMLFSYFYRLFLY